MRKHRQTRHSLMAKGLMVLLSLLVLVFALTYAWFTDANTSVTASGLEAQTRSALDLKVSVGFSNSQTNYQYNHTAFASSVNLRQMSIDGVNYDLMANYSPKDMTGNGASLYIPALKTEDNRRSIDTLRTGYYFASPNIEYLSYDMIFKCEQPCSVKLGSGSYLKAECESSIGDGSLLTTDTSESGRKSSYGDFSVDAVVGAIRIAFTDYNEGNNALNLNNIFEDNSDINGVNYLKATPELVWLPRPDIYLYDSGDEDVTLKLFTNLEKPSSAADLTKTVLVPKVDSNGVVVKQNGVIVEEEKSVTFDNTYVHSYYDVVNQTPVSMANKTKTSLNSDKIAEVTIPHYDENNQIDYYLGKVHVNIWIEGTDAEARRAIAGGQFRIHLDLSGDQLTTQNNGA